MSRILFTCLAANPKSSLIAQPSEQLEVNELYKRAVKVVRDYEASEIGFEIVEAWKKLQEIADKLGRFQAGYAFFVIQMQFNCIVLSKPILVYFSLPIEVYASVS